MGERPLRMRKADRDKFMQLIGGKPYLNGTMLIRKLRTGVLFVSIHEDRLAKVMALANDFPGVVAVVQTQAGYVEVAF